MSSGYKIKGHQRSRSAKPYERKTVSIYHTNYKQTLIEESNSASLCVVSVGLFFSPSYVRVHLGIIFKLFVQGLVNRVKEWLTPSSWLNSWNKSSSDATGPSELELELEQRLGATQREDDNMPSLSHSASPLFVPRPGALRNPFLSNPMALLGVPGSQPEPSDVNRTLGEAPPTSVGVVSSRNGSPHSTSNAFHSGTGMESRPRSLASVPLSLRGSGVPSGPTSMANAREDFKMMTDASSSKDSEGSWVAEDDGSMEQEKDDSVSSDGRDQSSEQPRTKSFPTTLNLSGETERSEVYTYELGEGSAGVVQPAMCVTPVVVTEAEQAILQVENPAAKSPPPTPSSPPSSCTTPPATTTVTASADGRRTMLSSSLLNRLYTTNPFAMSTPQLSPVHETREENVSLIIFPLSHHERNTTCYSYSTVGSSRICPKIAGVPFWF